MSNSLIIENNERASSYVVGIIVSNLQAEKNVVPQLLSAKTMETWKTGYADDKNASQSQQTIVVEEASLHSRFGPGGATQVFYQLSIIGPCIAQLLFFHTPYALDGFDMLRRTQKDEPNNILFDMVELYIHYEQPMVKV